MSEQNIVGIVFDCDDTLCEDSTTFLLKKLDINADKFWRGVNLMVRKGWDPPLATMWRLIKLINSGQIKLTNSDLRRVGAKITFFPGIPELFDELQEYVDRIEETEELGVKIEYYVVTSGFEELLRGSIIAKHMTDVFGCTFDVNPRSGILRFPKSVVTFTEKTKFVFAINKGIPGKQLRRSPYEVNNVVEEDRRRIPFRSILYIGDGPSDTPCFSLLMKNGGYGIGVYGKKSVTKAWQLAKGRRMTVGPYPCDYSKGQPLRTMIHRTIKEIALDILRHRELKSVPAPRYS
jgi:hypothetical protein